MLKIFFIISAWILLISILVGNFILDAEQFQMTSNWIYFLVGLFLSYFLVFRRKHKLIFYMTFEHELTHNIWAMLTFNKPTGFHVNQDGSGLFQFEMGSNYSRIFITLAPYFFPTSCMIWLLFYEFFKPEYHFIYFSLMGIFFGYQFFRIQDDFGSHQTDIQKFGMLISLLFIIPMYIIFFGAIVSLTINGWQGIITHYYQALKAFFIFTLDAIF